MHTGIGFDTCISLIGSLAYYLSGCWLLLVLGEATRSWCLPAKRTLYLFMQFSRNLAMREMLYDCKHGELEWQKWKKLGNICRSTKYSKQYGCIVKSSKSNEHDLFGWNIYCAWRTKRYHATYSDHHACKLHLPYSPVFWSFISNFKLGSLASLHQCTTWGRLFSTLMLKELV